MTAARCAWVALMSLTLWSSLAIAHELRPAVVALREVSPEVFALRLTPAQDGGGAPLVATPNLPEHCAATELGVACPGGLHGQVSVAWSRSRPASAVVHVTWLDGRSWETLLRADDVATIPAPGVAPRSAPVARAWLEHGVEHILGGIDHLLFVLALALVARRPWRVAGAVTAFTVAHSVTLAATVLGFVSPPSAATELVIAASVLLLAAEAATRRETMTSRVPWLVAGGFGLVHGFGFAGALAELGLPEGHTALALGMFNLGVELGQLAVLGAFGLVAWLWVRALPSPDRAGRVVAWAIGLVAGAWTVERFAAWWSTLA